MTERLFWADPYAREFAARVVRRDGPRLVLDRTLFYPTSGGQPNDTGTINGVRVVDVVEEGETIVHVTESPVDATDVQGAIDWPRRLDHMQQHDGQHILSEAFVRVCGAETTSFHLGPETCTIDLSKPSVSAADLEAAERLANQIVWENRPIDIGFYSRDEVAKLPLRKPPAVDGRIRVVTVRDFDCSACCGTHAKTSGETGVIMVLGVERAKGDPRVTFVCGWRALACARQNAATIRTVGAKTSSSREELVASVERIMAEAAETRKALAAAEKQLAEARAKELASSAAPRGRARFVVELFESRDLKYLQGIASQIVAGPGLVAVLGATGATSSLVIARSADVPVDVRPIGKDALAAIGGKGGGPANFVQGGGPGANVRDAMKLAEDRLSAALA